MEGSGPGRGPYLLEETDAHGPVGGREHLDHNGDDLLLILLSAEELAHLRGGAGRGAQLQPQDERSHWAHLSSPGSLLISQGGNGVVGGAQALPQQPLHHAPARLALPLTCLGQASLRRPTKAPHSSYNQAASCHTHTHAQNSAYAFWGFPGIQDLLAVFSTSPCQVQGGQKGNGRYPAKGGLGSEESPSSQES